MIALRRFWSWLIGPLFFYDVVRTARRNRLIPFRCFYAFGMLVSILITYSNWFGFNWSFEPPAIQPNLLPSFANSLSTSIMILVISATFLLTPIYTATALGEERERGSLDLLLVTPLTSREIVLGLLASRLVALGMIILTGLPILSLLSFLGGVDPNWVIGTFFHAGFLMVVQGSLGLYASIRAKDSRQAILEAYLWSLLVVLFLFCCPCMYAALNLWSPRFWIGVTSVVPLLIIPGSVAGIFGLFFLSVTVARLRTSTIAQNPKYMPPLRIDWGTMADFFEPTLAIFGLTIFGKTHSNKEEVQFQWLPGDLICLPVSDPPMLWKDFHRKRSNLQILINGLFISFYLSFWILFLLFESDEVLRTMCPWANCVLLLPVAIISAQMVSQEREKRTLDSLLLTRLETKEILLAKWWASVFPMKWIILIHATVLGMVTIEGALHPLAYLFLIASLLVYICFVACVGLIISTLTNTVLKASMTSAVTLMILVSAGPLGLISPSTSPDSISGWLKCAVSYLLSPIHTMRVLAFDIDHLEKDALRIYAALSAVVLVGFATWGLWKGLSIVFEKVAKSTPR